MGADRRRSWAMGCPTLIFFLKKIIMEFQDRQRDRSEQGLSHRRLKATRIQCEEPLTANQDGRAWWAQESEPSRAEHLLEGTSGVRIFPPHMLLTDSFNSRCVHLVHSDDFHLKLFMHTMGIMRFTEVKQDGISKHKGTIFQRTLNMLYLLIAPNP